VSGRRLMTWAAAPRAGADQRPRAIARACGDGCRDSSGDGAALRTLQENEYSCITEEYR
jgi:hypothetical protein